MAFLQYGSRRAAASLRIRSIIPSHPRHASRVAARIPFTPPAFPVIESCPAPTCQCQEIPPGLEIDREASLNGSIAAYAEQVLISTGKADWTSKIEDEDDAVFLRQMKKFMGRGGKYSDPFHNVLLTNSSLPPTPIPTNSKPTPSTQPASHKPASVPTSTPGTDPEIDPQHTPANTSPASAFLLPSFEYVPSIPTDDSSIDAFIKAFILPSQLHAHNDVLTRDQKNILLRESSLRRRFPDARKVNDILVLICGHGGRDQRCGTLGPILQAEFEEKLARQNILVLKDAPALAPQETDAVEMEKEGYVPSARVAQISHIGGHKFAGNVIVYIPPSFKGNALAGKGIWYGRVEPQHVEGIVAKTLLDGKVIKDHFRGGMGQDGEVMRM